MELKQHQKEVKKLNKLEMELTHLIINTHDGEILSKFFLWQDQRKVCNKGFVSVCDKILNKINTRS